MGTIQFIRSEVRERHVHILAPTLVLGMGMYTSYSGVISEGSLTIFDLIIAASTLSSIPYLFYYGLRISPYEELQSLTKIGLLTWFGLGFILVAWGERASAQGAQQYLVSSTIGTLLFSILSAIVGATLVLVLPLILRAIYRRVAGNGGDGDGTGGTPEEEVLSKKELNEFDHPNKKLRRLICEICASS